MTDEQIVTFIKDLVIDQRKTIDEIASESKVSIKTLNNILRKRHAISPFVREKMERYYKKIFQS